MVTYKLIISYFLVFLKDNRELEAKMKSIVELMYKERAVRTHHGQERENKGTASACCYMKGYKATEKQSKIRRTYVSYTAEQPAKTKQKLTGYTLKYSTPRKLEKEENFYFIFKYIQPTF